MSPILFSPKLEAEPPQSPHYLQLATMFFGGLLLSASFACSEKSQAQRQEVSSTPSSLSQLRPLDRHEKQIESLFDMAVTKPIDYFEAPTVQSDNWRKRVLNQLALDGGVLLGAVSPESGEVVNIKVEKNDNNRMMLIVDRSLDGQGVLAASFTDAGKLQSFYGGEQQLSPARWKELAAVVDSFIAQIEVAQCPAALLTDPEFATKFVKVNSPAAIQSKEVAEILETVASDSRLDYIALNSRWMKHGNAGGWADGLTVTKSGSEDKEFTYKLALVRKNESPLVTLTFSKAGVLEEVKSSNLESKNSQQLSKKDLEFVNLVVARAGLAQRAMKEETRAR